ncbi:MAG: hypothetical protein DME22_09865 [Verrucomicrobia bacterium]|nr:MAG: hypothetical protein DME22_09865 [Verrucomicrobiota bacterium]
MVLATNIRELRTAATDYIETERLKAQLRDLRTKRDPLFLTTDDLEPIFRWKLGNQYGRNKRQRDTNTDSAYQAITQTALSIKEPELAYEAKLRTAVLISLRGVGVPVASAILALTDPEHYCVIDFRGWRAVFDEERRAFDIPAYIRYLGAIRELAEQLGWPVQETDLAVWEYDRRTSGRWTRQNTR